MRGSVDEMIEARRSSLEARRSLARASIAEGGLPADADPGAAHRGAIEALSRGSLGGAAAAQSRGSASQMTALNLFDAGQQQEKVPELSGWKTQQGRPITADMPSAFRGSKKMGAGLRLAKLTGAAAADQEPSSPTSPRSLGSPKLTKRDRGSTPNVRGGEQAAPAEPRGAAPVPAMVPAIAEVNAALGEPTSPTIRAGLPPLSARSAETPRTRFGAKGLVKGTPVLAALSKKSSEWTVSETTAGQPPIGARSGSNHQVGMGLGAMHAAMTARTQPPGVQAVTIG